MKNSSALIISIGIIIGTIGYALINQETQLKIVQENNDTSKILQGREAKSQIIGTTPINMELDDQSVICVPYTKRTQMGVEIKYRYYKLVNDTIKELPRNDYYRD